MRGARRYAAASAGCAALSFVYELFSHEVYSAYMVGLFAVPLLLGAIPLWLCARGEVRVHWISRQLWACAVLTLSLGCCFAGVVEIYGTTSTWPAAYAMMAGTLALGAVATAFLSRPA